MYLLCTCREFRQAWRPSAEPASRIRHPWRVAARRRIACDFHGRAHPDFLWFGHSVGADVDNLLLRVTFANWNKVGRNLSLGFLFPIPKPRCLTFAFACGAFSAIQCPSAEKVAAFLSYTQFFLLTIGRSAIRFPHPQPCWGGVPLTATYVKVLN